MKRITIRGDHGVMVRQDLDFVIFPDDYDTVQEILGKLAAYEDTGQEPEEFKKAFNKDALLKLTAQYLGTTPERLLEMGQAERGGRLMVIPCDIGDKMWGIRSFRHGKRVMKGKVTDINIIPGEGLGISVRGVCYGKYGQEVFGTQEEAAAALERMV